MTLHDPWTAYQFDAAVTALGTIMENALQERVNRGNEEKPRWEPRYTLAELLTAGFVIADEDEFDDADLSGIDGLFFDEVGP